MDNLDHISSSKELRVYILRRVFEFSNLNTDLDIYKYNLMYRGKPHPKIAGNERFLNIFNDIDEVKRDCCILLAKVDIYLELDNLGYIIFPKLKETAQDICDLFNSYKPKWNKVMRDIDSAYRITND